jgi:hypothetical protein
MSGSFINDPQHWRGRAEEARTLADLMSDDMSKQMMLLIADDYDRLAKRAEQRAKQSAQSKNIHENHESATRLSGHRNQGNRFHGLRLVKHRV